MKWFSTFQATIDRAPKTSPKKMIHLQSLLTGEAKALVNGYGCNGDLYVSAINRLQEHFGNPKKNSKRISRKALKFQSPKSSSSGKLHTVLFIHFNNGGHFLTIRFHPRSTFNYKFECCTRKSSQPRTARVEQNCFGEKLSTTVSPNTI